MTAPFKKEFEYSYTFAVFPTFELLHHQQGQRVGGAFHK
jgi:hypothetical protein